MSEQHDIFTDHYCLLRRDSEARSQLINDPVGCLKEYFGFMPDGDYRIEVVPQERQLTWLLRDMRSQWAATAKNR
jgi:hypothetical protein